MEVKKIQYSKEIIENFRHLLQQQKDLIVNIPITQKLYDNLTLLAPSLWEILIPESSIKNISEFKDYYHFIPIPPQLYYLCDKSKVKVSVKTIYSNIQIFALSPEFALIYALNPITIPRILIALGILKNCEIHYLKNLVDKYYLNQRKIVDFLLELASIRLYRSDKIWHLITKYQYQDILGSLSLYMRDFIKNEFIYEKVM